jgi:hypothetical protein
LYSGVFTFGKTGRSTGPLLQKNTGHGGKLLMKEGRQGKVKKMGKTLCMMVFSTASA